MAGQSERSNLVDVTYTQICSILSSNSDATTGEQVEEYLIPRLEQLKSLGEPFGKPSSASKGIVSSGKVTLKDGVVVAVEDADKDYVFAISSAFDIDEVQALILFRSFLYNEGLPPHVGQGDSDFAEELVEAITSFIFSEATAVSRVFIPLLRAKEDAGKFHDVAVSILSKTIDDGKKFVGYLLDQYLQRTLTKLPEKHLSDRKSASKWAKQKTKEQLVLLEVLFWTMWETVPCDGPTVERIVQAAYNTNYGDTQPHPTLLLDDEAQQLRNDIGAFWVLLTIEILELERLAEQGAIDISSSPSNPKLYISCPENLLNIHNLIISKTSGMFCCTYMAWTFVVSQIATVASKLKEVPPSYRPFLQLVTSQREPMKNHCFDPQTGVFPTIHALLTSSPVFVTALAWRNGSSITDPNAVAFRSVLKGLIVAIIELCPVELVPDLNGLVQVWVALFGRSESSSIRGICTQFWQLDWYQGFTRRALLDVARSRFPIQLRLLVRILRAMTATGFLDTDPLTTGNSSVEVEGAALEEIEFCNRHVFFFLAKLQTYSQVIPISATSGLHAMYERAQDRYDSSRSTPENLYKNLRDLRLPGGSILPRNSLGRVLSGDGADYVVVAWKHEHSGWKLMLDMLSDYVNSKSSDLFGGRNSRATSVSQPSIPVTLTLQDIGVEDGVDEATITDILDLMRSLIQNSPSQTHQLLHALESTPAEQPLPTYEAPDLVQLTSAILEEALSRSSKPSRSPPPTELITSSLSVLTAILAIPRYSNRVWIYLRSTAALFGSERSPGFTSFALAAERITGQYPMTLALLHLVDQLFHQISALRIPDDPELRRLQDEVLIRAIRFVHTEIWVEHLGWKYAQLGDRFEIGQRISSLYVDILMHTPQNIADGPFPTLSKVVLDILLFKTATSTITPLISSIGSGGQIIGSLYAARRFGDARKLIILLSSHLRLTRLVLDWKFCSAMANRPSLLEQGLCARVTGGAASHDPYSNKARPIDALAAYVKERDVGTVVPLEAVKVLTSLVSSLSACHSSQLTVIGHLSSPETVVASFVRIVQHPYDDMSLRYAIWTFIYLSMDTEPALATLLVSGKFLTPADIKGKEKELSGSKKTTALTVAKDTLASWEVLWKSNPQLLAHVLRFLRTVWQHGAEHKPILAEFKTDEAFWEQITAVACNDLGPIPDFEPKEFEIQDGIRRSKVHDGVSNYCYSLAAKSYALHIIATDLDTHCRDNKDPVVKKPSSLLRLERKMLSEEDCTDLLAEATPNSYRPELYDQMVDVLKTHFPGIDILHFQPPIHTDDREFGDEFAFSTTMLRSRLRSFANDQTLGPQVDSAEKQLLGMNLNLSLMETQKSLAAAWQHCLRALVPFYHGNIKMRPILLSVAASISSDIANENRLGDMAATVHGSRLALLLSIVELAWFSADTVPEVKSFADLFHNMRAIVLNEHQRPISSLLYNVTSPFHRPLLQLLYFCARFARNVSKNPKLLTAERRLKMSLSLEAVLDLVIDGLCVVFGASTTRYDVELDRDMELLVSVFEQCTRLDITPSTSVWLTKCQQSDVIRASLDLFVHADLVGLADLSLLVSRGQPLYAPHILLFHMSLASISSAAERFATEGILSAYSNNSLSRAISNGEIDITLSELPGQRSPAHVEYCAMLSVVSGIICAMDKQGQYFDAEACGFIQLYGAQIQRTMSWIVSDPLTLPLLEEMEQVSQLFCSLAQHTPAHPHIHPAVEKVLDGFTPLALRLLQQFSFSFAHPKQLYTAFEPLTKEERSMVEKLDFRDDSRGDQYFMTRPLTLLLMQRISHIVANILNALMAISRVDDVLLGDPDTWSLHQAQLVPHTKTVPEEPASVGTLIALISSSFDILQQLTSRPSGQIVVGNNGPSIRAFDVKDSVKISRQVFESAIVYCVTQMAMWLAKSDPGSGDVEMDEEGVEIPQINVTENRRGPRSSMTMSDRVFKRNLAGDASGEILSFFGKAKPLIEKSDIIIGPGSVNILPIMQRFLQERVVLLAQV